MERDKIQEKVLGVVSEKLSMFGNGEIRLESVFTDDLGADSLDRIEIIMGIEDEFDLVIPDSDVDVIKTVKDLVDYVAGKA